MKNYNILKYVVLLIIMYILCRNTVAMKYTATYCYRLDLSMAVVLYMAHFHFKWDDRTLAVFALKEIISLLFGNPGVPIFWHIVLTLSNALMDAFILLSFWIIMGHEGKKRVLFGAGATFTYSVFCVVLNIIYHARVSAAAYGLKMRELVLLASRYNADVHGFWSFQFGSLTYFYLFKYLLIVGIVAILFKVFHREEIADGTYAYRSAEEA